ncbi:MAG: undecaprenyl-diphosphate phosphatase [Muribaculaceae bacterium]|nr:undecaprenyl-diphosphate phosphatase [Muribaculaceae bacterium]
MDILTALILGIVQGLAEYLPISSSGHLEIFRQILGMQLDGAESLEFDTILHAATVLSTVVVLWKELWPMIVSFFTWRKDSHFYYVCKILVSCIPILIVGLCFKDAIEEYLFGQGLKVVGWCLIATAALLSFSYFFRTRPLDDSKPGKKAYIPRDISYKDAFIIGCAQSVAILPGLSRSGTTIATGILLGDKREQVAKFSFLMVIIPILGEALLQMKDILGGEAAAAGEATVGWAALLTGFIAAFVVGCIACKWMLAIVRKGKLVWFALYCLVVGLACILKNYGVL